MKFKPGDLIERVAWGTVDPNVQKSFRSYGKSFRSYGKSFRSYGAKGIIVQSSGKGTAVKVYWLDSQVTNIEWSHDLGKVSKAPPESQP